MIVPYKIASCFGFFPGLLSLAAGDKYLYIWLTSKRDEDRDMIVMK